jgi:radical SAM enzyme (TIGR01210 family)
MSEELKGAETVQTPEHLRGVSQEEVTDVAKVVWGLVMPEIRGEADEVREASGFFLPAGQAELSAREKEQHLTKNLRLHTFKTGGCGHVTGKHEVTSTGVDGGATLSAARTGCLYCDYGRCESAVSEEEMMGYIDRCIDGDPGYLPGDELKEAPDYKEMGAVRSNEGYDVKEYNITPLGSLFDENEVPPGARKHYFERLAEQKTKLQPGERMMVDFETRFEFVTEEKLKEMRDILGDDVDIDVGVGTESICEEIRELAGNKKMDPDWQEKVELLHKYNCCVLGHVLVKPPFLTEREAVMDAVGTVRYLEKHNLVDVFIVMTMNRRPKTLTPRLEELAMYELPSIWTVVEIMKQIGPELAAKSKFLGFQNNRNQENVVHGCDNCNDSVVSLILDYHGYPDEYEAIMKAAEENDKKPCECKNEWLMRMNKKHSSSLAERIATGMDTILASDQGTSFREVQELVKEGKNLAQVRELLAGRKAETSV